MKLESVFGAIIAGAFVAFVAVAGGLISHAVEAQIPQPQQPLPQVQRPPPELQRPPARLLGPAPQVTNWTPRVKAYPGQTLVITGTDFNPDALRVALVTDTGRIALTLRRTSSTRVEAGITDEMYTGGQGARLVISHVGGQERVLEPNFKVLERSARYSGASHWHLIDTKSSSVFTKGTVNIRLDMLEFADHGTGSYQETVRFVLRVGTTQRECPPLHTLKPGENWEWRTVRREREINWRKLPDGRIELNGVGIGEGNSPVRLHNAIGEFVGSTLNVNLSTTAAGLHAQPYIKPPYCEAPGIIVDRPAVFSPLRLVEWSLARLDLH
jgi:hypothetical protein